MVIVNIYSPSPYPRATLFPKYVAPRLHRQISIFIHLKFPTRDHAYAFIFLCADVYVIPIGQTKVV